MNSRKCASFSEYRIQWVTQRCALIQYRIWMAWCERDISPLLIHRSYISFALSHRYDTIAVILFLRLPSLLGFPEPGVGLGQEYESCPSHMARFGFGMGMIGNNAQKCILLCAYCKYIVLVVVCLHTFLYGILCPCTLTWHFLRIYHLVILKAKSLIMHSIIGFPKSEIPR